MKKTNPIMKSIDFFIDFGCKVLKMKRETLIEIFLYLLFGFLTTALNIAVDLPLRALLTACGLPFDSWLIAVPFAWIIGVVFAFVTNKIFVFKSKDYSLKTWFTEGIPFVIARLLSLGLEFLTTFLLFNLLGINETIVKLIAQVIVIVVNYIASKLIVFKNKN